MTPDDPAFVRLRKFIGQSALSRRLSEIVRGFGGAMEIDLSPAGDRIIVVMRMRRQSKFYSFVGIPKPDGWTDFYRCQILNSESDDVAVGKIADGLAEFMAKVVMDW